MLDRLQGAQWRNGDFLRLWSAQTVSEAGSQVTLLALPFVAILVLKAATFEMPRSASSTTRRCSCSRCPQAPGSIASAADRS
jgi:hypothetical protein